MPDTERAADETDTAAPVRPTVEGRDDLTTFLPDERHAVLAILFTDLAGSTKLAETMTAGAIKALRREHDAVLTEIIQQDGEGLAVKSTGDGLLAVFRTPTVAVERALEMQRVLRTHERLNAVGVRIGVHMGEVSVEPSAGTNTDVFGHNVAWAARAEAMARAGHICVTLPIYDDASRHLDEKVCKWKAHGEYVLKEGERPLDLYEPHEADAEPMDAPRGDRRYGDHPKTWNVPIRRNRNFTGREEILTEVYESLRAKDPAALTQTEAIHGLGGIGKTQIAAEYAHRYAGDYDCVWWVAAEDDAARPAEYARLARALDLPEKDEQEQDVIVAAVRDWLRTHGKWLLILDNAPAAESVHDLLPDGNSGHVIVTSRSAAWRDVARPVSVDTWPRDESIGFLRARTGTERDEHAGEVAAELGDLPLALEQAAAYMHEAAISYEAYLERYRTRRQALLARSAPRDHPEAVAVTWQVSMDRLRDECPEAADLLNVCAFLASEDVAREWIVDGAEHLPEPLASVASDPVDLDDAVAALRRYSLMAVAEDALSVHRLVQEVVRDGMSDDDATRWWECAVGLVHAAIPTENIQMAPAAWPTCERLLPHTRSVAGRRLAAGSAGALLGRILDRIATYLEVRAQDGEARTMYERAVRVGEAALGPDHPDVAGYVNNLGNCLRNQGDLNGAKAHLERALRTESALEPTGPQVAIVLNNLGMVLRAQGDLSAAREHYERAIRIDEVALGSDHPNVAIRVGNLGAVLHAQGDHEGARNHHRRALDIDEAAYGPNHPRVAADLNNLGTVLWAQGNLPAAMSRLERAVRIFEQFLGTDHPNTVLAGRNLDTVLRELRG